MPGVCPRGDVEASIWLIHKGRHLKWDIPQPQWRATSDTGPVGVIFQRSWQNFEPLRCKLQRFLRQKTRVQMQKIFRTSHIWGPSRSNVWACTRNFIQEDSGEFLLYLTFFWTWSLLNILVFLWCWLVHYIVLKKNIFVYIICLSALE